MSDELVFSMALLSVVVFFLIMWGKGE